MKQRTITPVDGSVYVERELAAEETNEKALATAVRAQTDWKRCPVLERVKIVRRMVEWCVARAEELGAELSWQMGRPPAQRPHEIRRGRPERAHQRPRGGGPSGVLPGGSRSAWCWSWRHGTTRGSRR